MRVQSAEAISVLGALANEQRLRIFRLLVQAGSEGLAAGTIASELGVANSTLSFHLAHLAKTGVVRQERRGRSLIYSADYVAVNALVGYLLENCCAGIGDCTPSTCAAQPTGQKREHA